MLISRIQNIPFISNIKQSNHTSPFKTLTNDVFIKTTSFGSKQEIAKEDQSFEAFEKWAEESGFKQNANEIVENKLKVLGSGFEGTVYELPNNDKWVLKRYKRSDFVPVANESVKITKINDISPELNIGQTIAKLEIPLGKNASSVLWVLKRQQGKSMGVSAEDAKYVNDNYNIHTQKELLKTLNSYPQSTYDKLISDIGYITEQGYAIDYFNPENIMHDTENQHINLVDINDKLTETDSQYGRTLYCLLGSQYADNYMATGEESEDKAEIRELTKNIVDKYLTAMRKSGVKFEDSSVFKLLIESRLLDGNIYGETSEEKYECLKQMKLF